MTTGAAGERDQWAAIILAAGAGRRFGGGKLLAPYGSGVLLDGAVTTALALAEAVVLVTGAQAEPVAEAAKAAAARGGQADRLKIVHAADHAEGMGASLRTGAAALPTGLSGVFILLGDMPLVPPAVGPELVAALAGGAQAAAPVHGGRRGHPVLVGRALIPRLAEARGDEGLRSVLAGLGAGLALAPCEDPGVLFDVDRLEDLPGR
ncbi:nucleotidyltransferase family protein [Phenylobacterium sp.]|uniref:nucleotidyltransferase family protein n=1 Tax=Phenylobacterium sp. TaxID=1871053 RepID=UPI002FDA5E0B